MLNDGVATDPRPHTQRAHVIILIRNGRQLNIGHLTLARNFVKCRPIFKFLSPSDSAINA